MTQLLKPGFFAGGYFESLTLNSISNLSPDEEKMKQSLLVAMKSSGITAPNPAVGCVVFREGWPVAMGATRAYRMEHAERVALDTFSGDTAECELFVTLEPCTHQGHQPPCIEAVNAKKWKRVVIAVGDPNPKVAGEGIRTLQKNQKEVVVGVLKNECLTWNLPFFFQQKFGRPMIVGKWAESKNGLLADDNNESKWISNEKSRNYAHWLRQKYDAILVGAKTFLVDRPLLNVRLNNTSRQPLRLVWDPKNRLSAEKEWLNSKEYLATGQKTMVIQDPNLAEVLVSQGFQEEVAKVLEKPLQSVMVEGGAKTLKHLFENDLMDLLHVFRGEKEFSSSTTHRSPIGIFGRPVGWTILSETNIGSDQLIEALPESRFKKIFADKELQR